MVKTSDNGVNVAPFLMKCYEMVDDQSTDGIISWSQSNDTFVIWDMTEFSRNLLPKYFKHQNFSSFMRQLNIYGFRKVDTDCWEFANEGFIKGQKQLLKNIKRRKHPQGGAQKNRQQDQLTGVSDEVDYTSLQKEVETLKTDKSVLMQELIKLKERRESSQNKLLLLGERLQGMENDQQQLLSFLVMVMQNPQLLVQLLHPKENNWRLGDSGKITLDKDSEYENNILSDGLIVRYQPLPDDAPSSTPTSTSETEKSVEHDLSFDRVKDFFMNFGLPPSPIDESFLSTENSGSIMKPEFDLAMLEQYLLSSPSRDNAEDAQLDGEESTGAKTGTESRLCDMQSEEYQANEGNNCPNLQLLTQQFRFLSPGKRS